MPPDYEEGEEYDEEDEDEDDDDDTKTASTNARPRRMSELNIKQKVKPIPPASSLFLFSDTNRCLPKTHIEW